MSIIDRNNTLNIRNELTISVNGGNKRVLDEMLVASIFTIKILDQRVVKANTD